MKVKYETCPRCKGTGVEHEPDYSPCFRCEGNGSIRLEVISKKLK